MGWYSSHRTFEKALSFRAISSCLDGIVLALLQCAQYISQRLIPSNCCLYSMLYWCVQYRTCFGPLAQLARASGLHPEGHRFEPGRAHRIGVGSFKLPTPIFLQTYAASTQRYPVANPRPREILLGLPEQSLRRHLLRRRACRKLRYPVAPSLDVQPIAGLWSCAENEHRKGN